MNEKRFNERKRSVTPNVKWKGPVKINVLTAFLKLMPNFFWKLIITTKTVSIHSNVISNLVSKREEKKANNAEENESKFLRNCIDLQRNNNKILELKFFENKSLANQNEIGIKNGQKRRLENV